jgi:type IV secretory pathway VirB2 component (pilin)
MNLNGYKTYICMAVCVVAGIAFLFGYTDRDKMEAVIAIFGALGGASLRQAAGQASDKAEAAVKQAVLLQPPQDSSGCGR